MEICKFCNMEFKRVGSHQYVCKSNPDRTQPKNQHSAGNYIIKDSTKQKLSESRKQFMADPINKLKISVSVSKTVNEKVKDGTWHNSFSRARCYEYNGIQLYGKWELAYAKYLDDLGIIWERPTQSFPYKFEDKIRRYTPDFFLVETNEWVEIKGYPTKKDFAKWRDFPYELKVLFGEDLFELGLIASFKKINLGLKH